MHSRILFVHAYNWDDYVARELRGDNRIPNNLIVEHHVASKPFAEAHRDIEILQKIWDERMFAHFSFVIIINVIIETNMETNWNQYFFDFIQTHLDKHWDWKLLSSNPNITMDIVEANPNKPWNWQWLSENPNITWDIVEANPNKPWSWNGLSKNPNITIDIVEANPNKP